MTEPLLFPRTLWGQRAERKEIKITRGLTPATNLRQPLLPCGKTEGQRDETHWWVKWGRGRLPGSRLQVQLANACPLLFRSPHKKEH